MINKLGPEFTKTNTEMQEAETTVKTPVALQV